jgi:hypothetical protein
MRRRRRRRRQPPGLTTMSLPCFRISSTSNAHPWLVTQLLCTRNNDFGCSWQGEHNANQLSSDFVLIHLISDSLTIYFDPCKNASTAAANFNEDTDTCKYYDSDDFTALSTAANLFFFTAFFPVTSERQFRKRNSTSCAVFRYLNRSDSMSHHPGKRRLNGRQHFQNTFGVPTDVDKCLLFN